MPTTSPASALVLAAPERLLADTRVDFCAAAMEWVARAAAVDAPTLLIDLARTRDVDASGLGMLMLLHRRAREQGVAIRLIGVSPSVRRLLVLTKLDGMFGVA